MRVRDGFQMVETLFESCFGLFSSSAVLGRTYIDGRKSLEDVYLGRTEFADVSNAGVIITS